jgi:hypothetical protein
MGLGTETELHETALPEKARPAAGWFLSPKISFASMTDD